MNKKILQILEFDRVKADFQGKLLTAQGQKELGALTPIKDKEKIQLWFDELADFIRLMQENEALKLHKTSDISEHLKRLELEANLVGRELLEIKRLVQLGINVIRYFHAVENVEIPTILAHVEKLYDLSEPAKLLEVIDAGGALYDNASRELMQIRSQIKKDQSEIRRIMQEMLAKQVNNLSENIVTMRNDRQVLAVKAEAKNKIPGVVHDISATGQTMYIEPAAVVTLNNVLHQKRIEEKNEITRIFQEISDALRVHINEIKQNAWLLGHLDLIKAKFEYMQANKASIPELAEHRNINLYQARHPLIDSKIVVANDIKFDQTLSTIVITGPNTGGKTITLKTVGLLTVMAQAGLPILAEEGSQIFVFDEIFADIGDEQSIEQSLSTFSSHMTNIVSILEKADKHSLVLFDELGAGTDPKEGAALAISILEFLRDASIKVMASTHYPELKAYGVETERVLNASMEFDIDKMQPTYRLQLGVPGRSNAFEISRRLGLFDSIIDAASAQISDEEHDVNHMIATLEQKTKEAADSANSIRRLERENLVLHKDLTKVFNQINREYEMELKKAHEQAQELVKKAGEEAQAILADLNEKAQLKPHEIIAARAELEALVPNVDFSKNKVLKKAKAARGVKPGAQVMLLAYNQRGTLIRLEKDGRWTVQMGSITTKLSEDEFDLTEEEKDKLQPKVKAVKRTVTSNVKAQLDLRGTRYEEAEMELDNYIDQALLANLTQITIVHGIGTGVIREMVQKKLQRNRHIKSYEYAPINAGGSGATIAIIR